MGGGLTSMELSMLDSNLEYRTCRSLFKAVDSENAAMKLAREAGISSKVSQENFARAWADCGRILDSGDASDADDQKLSQDGPKDYPLFTMMVRGEFAECGEYIMERANLKR